MEGYYACAPSSYLHSSQLLGTSIQTDVSYFARDRSPTGPLTSPCPVPVGVVRVRVRCHVHHTHVVPSLIPHQLYIPHGFHFSVQSNMIISLTKLQSIISRPTIEPRVYQSMIIPAVSDITLEMITRYHANFYKSAH